MNKKSLKSAIRAILSARIGIDGKSIAHKKVAKLGGKTRSYDIGVNRETRISTLQDAIKGYETAIRNAISFVDEQKNYILIQGKTIIDRLKVSDDKVKVVHLWLAERCGKYQTTDPKKLGLSDADFAKVVSRANSALKSAFPSLITKIDIASLDSKMKQVNTLLEKYGGIIQRNAKGWKIDFVVAQWKRIESFNSDIEQINKQIQIVCQQQDDLLKLTWNIGILRKLCSKLIENDYLNDKNIISFKDNRVVTIQEIKQRLEEVIPRAVAKINEKKETPKRFTKELKILNGKYVLAREHARKCERIKTKARNAYKPIKAFIGFSYDMFKAKDMLAKIKAYKRPKQKRDEYNKLYETKIVKAISLQDVALKAAYEYIKHLESLEKELFIVQAWEKENKATRLLYIENNLSMTQYAIKETKGKIKVISFMKSFLAIAKKAYDSQSTEDIDMACSSFPSLPREDFTNTYYLQGNDDFLPKNIDKVWELLKSGQLKSKVAALLEDDAYWDEYYASGRYTGDCRG